MPTKYKTKPLWYSNKLREHGYKLTRPRKAIFDVLNSGDNHLSACNIYKATSKLYPNIGLATIYRTLELLVRIGVVLKCEFGDDRALYELAQNPEKVHHHHLICRNCNKVIHYSDFINDEKKFLKQRQTNLSRKYGFKIDSHFIDFFGLCKKCINKT